MSIGVHRFLKTLLKVAALVVAACSLAIVFYFLSSLFISTDTERNLQKENRMYERMYSGMLERRDLLETETEALRQKDDEIYRAIFHTSAPEAAPSAMLSSVNASDTIPRRKLTSYTSEKVASLRESASQVEDDLLRVFSILASGQGKTPPMEPPLDNVSYARVGASVGMKLNPFYKVDAEHGGLDIIAAQGDPVRAAQAGVVTSVVHSRKGMGNVVEIDHGNGYRTRYAHLSDVSVSRGMKIPAGRKIGSVGISGNALVPHLHYEVLRDTVPQDPVNFMFARLTPEEYADMTFMSINTRQSLD